MPNEEKAAVRRIPWSIPYATILFVILYFFYTTIHPLYIYDTDDWTYISQTRHALPQITQWNPTKILPETLMPLTAELGVRFIMPFSGDYIASMAYAFAVVISFSIVVYILCFGKIFKTIYKLDEKTGLLLMTILLLFHFLPFNIAAANNKYLLGGESVTILYNYLLPGLINSSLVMYLMVHEKIDWRSKKAFFKNGFFILVIYLCINSNMFHSVILISFIGTNLLVSLRSMRSMLGGGNTVKYALTEYIKQNMFNLAVLGCWLVSIWMESQGGRAKQSSSGGILNLPLKETVRQFMSSIGSMQKLFIVMCALIELTALGIYIISLLKSKKETDESEIYSGIDKTFIGWLGKELLCLIITVVYLLLLCAKVSPAYITQSLVMFSWMFWIMLIVFSALAYILSKLPAAVMVLPLLLFVLIFETAINGRSSYCHNYWPVSFSPQTVKELDENIVGQVKEAEMVGMDSVEVLIPVHDSDSFPMALSYGGERIAKSLYRHGIVGRYISITLVPDSSINDAFQLP